MINLQYIIDDQEVLTLLRTLRRKMRDLTPVMSEIGEILISSIEENIEVGGRYSSPGSWKGGSKKWEPLSPATILQRERKGYWPGKILQQEGDLIASLSKKADMDSVTVGVDREYARIQHLGGKAGRGKKVTIPARPYMVVQDEDLEEMKEMIMDYLRAK